MSKARLFARLINSSGDVEVAALDNIIDSAPGALDTLNELAAAINDDANVYTTLTNSIATKADTSLLATVATSGLYTDLSGSPTLATVATSGDYDDLIDKPTILSQAEAEDDATAVAIALG